MILAVIALIATPLILNIIEKARKNAFLDSAYGIIDSAKLYYTESLLDGKNGTVKEFSFDEENTELTFGGSKPKGGMVVIDKEGKISIAIYNDTWCAQKKEDASSIVLSKYEGNKCTLDHIPEVPDDTDNEEGINSIMKDSPDVMAKDPDGNLRYVGGNPKNYIQFNGDLWRIIGVFDGQVKIIKNDFSHTQIAWDTGNKNNWANASLMKELNDSDNESSYINQIKLNGENSYNQIDLEHIWNIGAAPHDVKNDSDSSRAKYYEYERGELPAGAVGSPIIWKGAIGLMYLSDYGYATSSLEEICENGGMNLYDSVYTEALSCWSQDYNWLLGDTSSSKQFTMTPGNYDGREDYVFFVYWNDTEDISAATRYAVRPVLFLKPKVKIISGEGTKEIPYILGM